MRAFEDMGPRDDEEAAEVAQHWMDLIIEDCTPPEGAMPLPEYALALGHLKELLAVYIDAALADIAGRRGTAKAVIAVGYIAAHCYPRPMGVGRG